MHFVMTFCFIISTKYNQKQMGVKNESLWYTLCNHSKEEVVTFTKTFFSDEDL